MSRRPYDAGLFSAAAALVSLTVTVVPAVAVAQVAISQMPGGGPRSAQAPSLPSAVNFSRVIGWPQDRIPAASEGFEINAFATGLDSPRWLYFLPNGDVLAAEARTLPRSDRPAEMQQGLVAAGLTISDPTSSL
jgi:glucose/arabinose dehydrogenase